MKEEIYNVGDRVTFQRTDGTTTSIAHIKQVNITGRYYRVDWSNGSEGDKFDFSDVHSIQIGKRREWKITGVVRKIHLPEDLFVI